MESWELKAKELYRQLVDQQRIGGAATIDDLLNVFDVFLAYVNAHPEPQNHGICSICGGGPGGHYEGCVGPEKKPQPSALQGVEGPIDVKLQERMKLAAADNYLRYAPYEKSPYGPNGMEGDYGL